MSQTRNDAGGDRREEDARERSTEGQRQDEPGGATAWFASTAVRAGLTLVGLVVLLFALGQAFGLPLLEVVADALTSQTGQWLVVAFFAVLLIGAAQKVVPSG